MLRARRWSWLRRLLALQLALLGVGTLAAGLAGATNAPAPTGNGIAPTYGEGSSVFRDCAAATNQAHIFGLKLEAGSLGGYAGTFDQNSAASASYKPNNPLVVTIGSPSVSGGVATFGWSANLPVDYVIVKAGPGALVYDYSSYGWGGRPASGPFGDSGLASPKDSISHILFCTIKQIRVEKTAAGSFTRTHHWDVEKQVKIDGEYADEASFALHTGEAGHASWKIVVDHEGYTDSGAAVSGAITVLNASPFSADVSLSESLAGATFGDGCPAFSLSVGAAKTCAYSAPVAAPSAGTNTVTATATNLSWMSPATASAPFAFDAPTSEVDKTVAWNDSNGMSKGGLTATDSHEYGSHVVCDEDEGEHVNTVTLTGDGGKPLDQDSATLAVSCSPARHDLVVEKTADLAWTRVNNWSVSKTATPASHALKDGAEGVSTWQIDVEKTSESFYLVHGTITVTNPNTFEAEGVNLDESLSGAEIECDVEVDEDGEYDLAPQQTLRCTYWAEVDSNTSGLNTVTVSTDDEDISGIASDAWEALEQPNAGDVNASIRAEDARLEDAWTVTSSMDGDRSVEERFPCMEAAYTNTVALLGDNPETEAVEEDYELGRAQATVTTTCSTTPSEEPGPDPTPERQPGPQPEPQPQPAPAAASEPAPLTPPVAELAPQAKPKPKAAAKPKAKANAKKKPTVKAKKKTIRTKAVKKKTKKAQRCVVLRLTKKSVPAGERSKLGFVLTAGGKPVAGVRVRLSGPGILKIVKSGKSGRIATSIAPRSAGIVRASVIGRKGCVETRLGVVQAFEPPVTG